MNCPDSSYRLASAKGKSLAESGNIKELREILACMTCADMKKVQWSAAVVHHCGELNPVMFGGFMKEIVAVLREPLHPAVPRAILRTMLKMDIPRKWHGTLANLAFNYLSDPMAPVAHKVYAMAILARFALDYPDLIGELKAAIQFHYPTSSPAFQSRAKRIAKLHDFHPEKG